MKFALFAVASLLLVRAAAAVPITYIHKGSATGTVAGVPFASTFTIVSSADTDNRASFPNLHFYYVDNAPAQIVIDNVGTFHVLSRTTTFVNQDLSLVGFSNWGVSDVYDGPLSNIFQTWDLISPIGPVNGTARLFQNGNNQLETDAGILRFDDALVENASFQAILSSSQPGDTDADGDVDLDDVNNVRNFFGTFGPGDTAPFDGDVDLDDLNAVRNNFGAGGATPIPEPSSLALLALGVVGIVARRRMVRGRG